MVKIYTQPYCPYCVSAKNLLNSLNIPYEEIDVGKDPKLMKELTKRSGMRTVPQIYVWEKCLWWYSDIASLHEKGLLMKEFIPQS